MTTLSSETSFATDKIAFFESNKLKLEQIGFVDRLIKRIVVNPVLNYCFNVKVIECFERISGNQILKNLKDGPGSWKSMLAHYHEMPKNFLDHIIDRYISFPSALRNRRKLVIYLLTRLIEAYDRKGLVNLVDVGSGSGEAVLRTIRQIKSRIGPLKAQFFDMDQEAVREGQILGLKLGLEREVNFTVSHAIQIEEKIKNPPQIVKMIGLLEYLSDGELTALFENVSRFRSPSSSIMISSIEPSHGIDRFLRQALNFHLNYRSPKRLIKLLSQYGYGRFNIFPEPTGVFNVILGHTKDVDKITKD